MQPPGAPLDRNRNGRHGKWATCVWLLPSATFEKSATLTGHNAEPGARKYVPWNLKCIPCYYVHSGAEMLTGERIPMKRKTKWHHKEYKETLMAKLQIWSIGRDGSAANEEGSQLIWGQKCLKTNLLAVQQVISVKNVSHSVPNVPVLIQKNKNKNKKEKKKRWRKQFLASPCLFFNMYGRLAKSYRKCALAPLLEKKYIEEEFQKRWPIYFRRCLATSFLNECKP